MKQFLKKLSLMLLVASLVLACVPAVVNALPIQTGRFTPVEKVTMHFPDRRDPDQRVRIERSGLTSIEMLPLAEEGEYLTDIQDAAAVLRQGMQKRQDQISVLYQLPASEDVWVNAVDPIWEDAFGHTGDPTAGDYLLWQYGAYSISCGGYTDGVNNYYTLEFIIDYYTTREQETEVDAAVAQLLGSLDLEGKSDYEKLCAVYDWMCANIYYDYAHLDDLSYKQMFTAYAALIDRTSVCQGYAVLLYRLMLELGIDCRVITGDAGGPHAWNIVQLDGRYYNLDSTWDASWYPEYNYFLRSDATFEGHFRDEEYATVEFYSQYPMGDLDYTPTVAAEIASGAYGENVTWVLTDEGRLTISGYGAMEGQDSGMMMPWFSYWETITSVVVESGITEIPAYTFEYLENVKTIELPDTLTSLTLNAFNDCGSLNHLLLPASLTNIYGWSNTGVPEFIRCESLTDVYYLGTEEEWLAIPNAGTVANRYAEMEIHFLRLYEDPPTCTESGTQSFYMFDDTSVYDDLYDLNKKVISEPAILEATGHIGEGEVVAPTCTEQGYTTYICTVCGVNVVDDVVEKDIRYGHKYENGLCIYCGLEDGAITGGRCGDHLYWNYYLGSRLVIYGEGPMYDYAAENQPWHNFKGTMLSVEIRDGATSIGVMAFQGYAYITSVKLPDTVQQIGEKAFYDCIRLKSVTLKEELQTIGDSAFRNCRSIESLNLPESLTEIGNYTFFGCDMLTQLQIGKNVTTIGNSAFPMNMMIFCYEGTPAYTYAVNHGSPFCVSPDDMPLGHSYVSEVIAPTCTEEGYTVHICSNCGHNYADAFVDALGHDMSAWVQTKAPTCTEAGEEQSSCNRCGHIETRELAALGHNEVTDAAVAPTCTATGLTEGKHCDRCGEILLAQTEVAALGHNEVIEAAVTPTCTGTGLTEGKHCDRCGEILVPQEIVAALGHNEVIDAAVAPTCTATGLTEGKHCDRCGEILIPQEVVAALGHSEVVDAAVAPTCTATGLTEGKHCDRCGEILVPQEIVAALGHNEVIDAAVAPTCTATGLTEGKHCDRCGEVLVAQTEVPATGHSFGEWNIVKEATEEAEGLKERACQTCGHMETEVIAKLDHVHAYESVVTEPTCTEGGYTTYTCRCGDSYTGDETAALGHDMSAWTQTKAPTCTEKGEEQSACSHCDHVETREVEALGHNEVIDAAVAPTCTATGLTEGKHCDRCGEVLVVQTEVPATGHSYGQWYTVTEPSDYVEGLEKRDCQNCWESETRTIPATDHSHNPEAFEAVVTAPTCTEQGYTTYTCYVCGYFFITDYVEALGHNYESVVVPPTCTEEGYTRHTCTVCGTWYDSDYVFPQLLSYWVIVKQPTAEEEGLAEKVCAICGETEQKVLPKKQPAEPIADLAAAFRRTLNRLDHFYDLDEYYMAKVVNEYLLADFDYDACLAVPAAEYEALLNRYFAVDEAILDTIRTFDDPWFLRYDEAEQIYIVAQFGGMGGSMPPREMIGYVNDGNVYKVFYAHINYVYLRDVLPDGVDEWDYAEQLGWPETIEYNGVVYENGPDGYYIILGLENYGIVYTVEVNDDVVRIISQEDYSAEDLPEHLHLHVYNAKDPTCTEQGYRAYTCDCGDIYSATYTDALGHDMSGWTQTKAPTCTEAGEEQSGCNRCGQIETREVEALGHNEVIDAAVAPTCTATGLTEGKHCDRCGEILVSQEVIATTGHSFGEWNIVKEATEEEEGLRERSCQTCGHVESEVIAKLDHVHAYESVITEPTCTEGGYTTYTCRCGDSYTADETAALGHDMSTCAQTKAPTCTEKGEEQSNCSRCDHIETREVEALGHNEVTDAAVAPTCTATGLTEGKHCDRCGEILVPQTEVPATGHSFGEWYTVTEPGEYEDGLEQRDCANCDHSETRAIPAEGHTHSYEPVVTAPTCTEGGYTTYTCRCGDSYTGDETAALGHDLGDWTITKQPTCTEKGEEQQNCSRCDYSESREVAELGHNYISVVTAPTCTENGYTTYTCRCGDSYTADEVPALGHNYSSEITAPTCTEKGYTTHSCTNCGASYTSDEVAALGHSWDDGIITREPTVEAEGEKTYTCTTCGETRTEVLPKKEPVIYDIPEDDSVQIPENDCFEGGTTVTVEKVEEGEIFDQVTNSMENRAETYTVFEFTASKDGEVVQPNGKLTVSFAIPADYSTNVALYYMDERGNLTKLEIVIDTENRTVTVELEHFSTYILTDEDTAPSVIPGDANGDGKVNARDARLILRYAASLITDDEIDKAAADFNGDGKVNARDARAVLRAAAGLN